jgi:hypothetical protein
MGFLFSLLGAGSLRSKIIMVALIAAVLGGGYFVYSQKMQILKAKEETLQVKGERDQAFKDRDAAVDANKTTNETLKQVLQERKDAQLSVSALANRDKANKLKIDKLAAIIEELSNQPESKVELSPILKETVRKIQEDREGVKQ